MLIYRYSSKIKIILASLKPMESLKWTKENNTYFPAVSKCALTGTPTLSLNASKALNSFKQNVTTVSLPIA